jgi:hypothetical protein
LLLPFPDLEMSETSIPHSCIFIKILAWSRVWNRKNRSMWNDFTPEKRVLTKSLLKKFRKLWARLSAKADFPLPEPDQAKILMKMRESGFWVSDICKNVAKIDLCAELTMKRSIIRQRSTNVIPTLTIFFSVYRALINCEASFSALTYWVEDRNNYGFSLQFHTKHTVMVGWALNRARSLLIPAIHARRRETVHLIYTLGDSCVQVELWSCVSYLWWVLVKFETFHAMTISSHIWWVHGIDPKVCFDLGNKWSKFRRFVWMCRVTAPFDSHLPKDLLNEIAQEGIWQAAISSFNKKSHRGPAPTCRAFHVDVTPRNSAHLLHLAPRRIIKQIGEYLSHRDNGGILTCFSWKWIEWFIPDCSSCCTWFRSSILWRRRCERCSMTCFVTASQVSATFVWSPP